MQSLWYFISNSAINTMQCTGGLRSVDGAL